MYKQYWWYKSVQNFFFLLYASFLVYAVFFARRRRSINRRLLNLVPVKYQLYEFRYMHAADKFNFYSNLLGNIFLFMPMPFILIIFFRIKKNSSLLLTGFLISLGIELIQYIFEVGVADIDDIILNTLGIFIGICCY